MNPEEEKGRAVGEGFAEKSIQGHNL